MWGVLLQAAPHIPLISIAVRRASFYGPCLELIKVSAQYLHSTANGSRDLQFLDPWFLSCVVSQPAVSLALPVLGRGLCGKRECPSIQASIFLALPLATPPPTQGVFRCLSGGGLGRLRTGSMQTSGVMGPITSLFPAPSLSAQGVVQTGSAATHTSVPQYLSCVNCFLSGRPVCS